MYNNLEVILHYSEIAILGSGKGVAVSGYFSDATRDVIKYLDFPEKNVTNTLNIAWHSDNASPVLTDFINSFPLDPQELTSFDTSNRTF